MVTIKDVALKSGFSVTTVSRALNGYDDVNENSRKKILEVAKNLNYVPNRAAQNLVKKENKTVAIIVSGMEKEGSKNNIIYSLISGMYTNAEKKGFEVALFTMSSAYQKEKSYMQFCREHNINGAIMTGIRTDDKYFEEIMDSTFPCVLIDIPIEGKNISCITIDNIKASKEIVKHLIDNNHKNIAIINGVNEAIVSHERLKGYKEALKESDIKLNKNYIVEGDFLEEKAYIETKKLLTENKEITAIYCVSDIMALGAMKAIKELSLNIPEDVSIVGFDDIPIAEYTTPPLTTVRQDFYERGKESFNQLYNMIKSKPYEKNKYVEYQIVKRGSVKKI